MIVENLAQFGRVLRRAGLPVGPDRVLAAVAALQAVGLERRDDVHAALAAVMLDRHEQQAVFDAAFEAFWRDPRQLERMMTLLRPNLGPRDASEPSGRANRVAEALAPGTSPPPPKTGAPDEQPTPVEPRLAASARERLQQADFGSMTTAEFAAVKALVERLPPPFAPVQRRRRSPAERGSPDLRATLRRMARSPHTLLPLRTQPRREMPAAVLLLDISGSMQRYARIMLHYAHGLVQRRQRWQVFTFGTRLTNVTRALRVHDPDAALAAAAAQVQDWHGGTRIASSLAEFNQRWARRVLCGNAALLLVTDGLDRDAQGDLSQAAAQLRRLAHEIVWLSPLLRFAAFEPRAAGIRALLPHVDRFLPVHNLASLADLGRALAAPARRPATTSWN